MVVPRGKFSQLLAEANEMRAPFKQIVKTSQSEGVNIL